MYLRMIFVCVYKVHFKSIVFRQKNYSWTFFLYNLDIFVWLLHDCLANTVFILDPSNCVIKGVCIDVFSCFSMKIYVALNNILIV